jgi:hypothetical protein
MEASNNGTGFFIKIFVAALGFIALYYLYNYLFAGGAKSATTLIGPKTNAQTDAAKPIIIPASGLPGLYEGGEFSVSMWVYVQNWSYRMGRNKHILSIGGNTFDTIRVYLGGNKPQLRVRLHTKTQGQVPSSETMSTQVPTDSLEKPNRETTFSQLETDSGMLDSSPLCDLPEIDLQRWVYVTISVNGKTIDVYLDGKLARSCVLPTFYKVDSGGYSATLLGYGGYGGYISGVQMYNYAVSPDQVYHQYMAGPEPITGLGQWFKSFFEPQSTINV